MWCWIFCEAGLGNGTNLRMSCSSRLLATSVLHSLMAADPAGSLLGGGEEGHNMVMKLPKLHSPLTVVSACLSP